MGGGDLNIQEKTAALVVVAGARLVLSLSAQQSLTTPIFRNTCQLLQTSSQSLDFPDF